MKLIFCPECKDMVKLKRKKRTCNCGKAYGYYTSGIRATIGGTAIPVGFDNISFSLALMLRPEEGQGSEFTAFVIPKKCSTIEEEE